MKTHIDVHLHRLPAGVARAGRSITGVLCFTALLAQASVTVTNLYTFDTSRTNGSFPNSLVQVPGGDFYGVYMEGASDSGGLFRLTAAGAFTKIATFTGGNEGGFPRGLCLGADGNLYGVTTSGGANYAGVIFRSTTGGALTTLVTFPGGTNDGYPSKILRHTDGNLYGLSTGNGGAVFKLTAGGQFSVVHRGAGGPAMLEDLVEGSDGNLYGTTWNYLDPTNGSYIYKLTTAGVRTPLYYLPANGSGVGYNNAFGPLAVGKDGHLYCTTSQGGANAAGNIFRLTTAGAFTSLHDFSTNGSGAMPYGMVQAPDGSFYGATSQGGPDNHGVLFQLTLGGVYQVVYTNTPDDPGELLSAIVGQDGNIYAVAGHSTTSAGLVRRISLPQQCFYTFPVSGTNINASGGSGGFTVANTNGCAWSAASGASWVHTSSSGSGNGTVTYTVDGNAGTSSRTGTIEVGGQSFTITQAAPGWITHIAFGSLWDTGTGWFGGSAYGWIWFHPGGQWIWSSSLQGWLASTDPNSRALWSTQFRWLTPSATDPYLAETTSIGTIYVGKYNGANIADSWVVSPRFGYVWANGDGEWFYSDQYGWLGVTPEGGIWCVNLGKFL
jgi:uncharacterized repeat protein (TIGR03803 family)